MLKADIDTHNHLSKKEEDTLTRLATGLTYKAIAEETYRSEETVRSHAKAIREKMQCNSIVEAVSKAIARGWLEIKEVGIKTTFTVILTVSASYMSDDNDLLRTGRINRPTVSRNKEL